MLPAKIVLFEDFLKFKLYKQEIISNINGHLTKISSKEIVAQVSPYVKKMELTLNHDQFNKEAREIFKIFSNYFFKIENYRLAILYANLGMRCHDRSSLTLLFKIYQRQGRSMDYIQLIMLLEDVNDLNDEELNIIFEGTLIHNKNYYTAFKFLEKMEKRNTFPEGHCQILRAHLYRQLALEFEEFIKFNQEDCVILQVNTSQEAFEKANSIYDQLIHESNLDSHQKKWLQSEKNELAKEFKKES